MGMFTGNLVLPEYSGFSIRQVDVQICFGKSDLNSHTRLGWWPADGIDSTRGVASDLYLRSWPTLKATLGQAGGFRFLIQPSAMCFVWVC